MKSTPDIQDKRQALQILVAEDTRFNQQFIQHLLNRWGHQSVIVENGIDAVKAAAGQSFDVILMDVEMPKMDGFRATAEIRRLEKGRDRRTPIIAMTAHSLKGDRERCLSAGMDDYISKPIAADALGHMIAALAAAPQSFGAQIRPDAPALFDKKALLKAFDNDQVFFREALEMFLSDYPKMLSAIAAAIKANDPKGLRLTAHALKGMVGNFQAKTAASAALTLEEMGRNQDLSGARQAFEKLTAEIKDLKQALITFSEEEPR